MVELLKPYGIRELSRTGVTAMIRGNRLSKMQLEAYSSKLLNRPLSDAPV